MLPDISQFAKMADNMPRPIYIICAESIVEDKNNSLTLFRVTEMVGVMRVDTSTGQSPNQLGPLKFQLAAVWMRKENEEAGPFEFEFRMHVGDDYLSQGGQGSLAGQFTFSHRIHKILMRGEIGRFPAIGLLEMECRVRPVGGNENSWTAQSFPMILIDQTPGTTVSGAPSSAAPQRLS